MIWLIFAFLCLVVVALLLTVRVKDSEQMNPIDHYKGQLKELEADEKRGVIDAGSVAAARLEIERRILKLAHQETGGAKAAGAAGARAIYGVAGLLVIGAFALYMLLGRPDLPAKPAAIFEARNEPIQEGGPTFAEAISSVQDHLAINPEDQTGWQVLAKSSSAVEEYSLAAKAYNRLAELDPADGRWRAQELEAYLNLAGGKVTPAARLVLSRLLQDYPDQPAGHYYLGLAHLQAGNKEKAKAVWQALADRSGSNAPWMPTLKVQLRSLGVKPPQLSKEMVESVGAMSEEDKAAFIRSMMDRLAARLEESPNDPQGWMMLARSHLAQGNEEEAISALKRGLSHIPADQAAGLQAMLDNISGKADP